MWHVALAVLGVELLHGHILRWLLALLLDPTEDSGLGPSSLHSWTAGFLRIARVTLGPHHTGRSSQVVDLLYHRVFRRWCLLRRKALRTTTALTRGEGSSGGGVAQ